MACHTFGRGVKVGPDLKGVTDRHKRDWLLSFISSSSKMIETRDPAATKLFTEFRRERMPDWSDLSPEQIGAILDYFAANGPEQKEPDERDAATASAREIAKGRDLFHGAAVFANGGRACHTCHAAGRDERVRDGSLGPVLTHTYLKYQDKALTDFLKRLCPPWNSEEGSQNQLTPQESFDLKAYLAQEAGLPLPMAGAGGPKDSAARLSH